MTMLNLFCILHTRPFLQSIYGFPMQNVLLIRLQGCTGVYESVCFVIKYHSECYIINPLPVVFPDSEPYDSSCLAAPPSPSYTDDIFLDNLPPPF